MEEREIVERATIILDAAQGVVTYVAVNGEAVDRKTKREEALDPPAVAQHPTFDLLAALRGGLSEAESPAFWRALQRVGGHSDRHHSQLGLVFLFMLYAERGGAGVDWFFNNFHLCQANTSALTYLTSFLECCDFALTNETLERIGDRFYELPDDPEVKRYAEMTPQPLKTPEEDERNSTAVAVFAYQYLIQPVIGKTLRKRLEGGHHPKPDVRSVVAWLESLGYPSDLREAWWRFEADWAKAGDPFSYKAALSLSRAFLEALAVATAERVNDRTGSLPVAARRRPADVRAYLSRPDVGVLTSGESGLLAAIYGHVSNTVVHSLSTSREDALGCRNLTVEAALILLNAFSRKRAQQ